MKKWQQFQKPTLDELKSQLSPISFDVTQKDGTEKPFQNPYWDKKEDGIYVDILSGEPLFASLHKYDSGTGWPSFYQPIEDDSVTSKTDRKLFIKRTEVRSKIANSHLGHVFDDGPNPTGKRYCMNSAAMRFIPKNDLEKEGYGEFLDLFKKNLARATFAAGCFWGVQNIFDETLGVKRSRCGHLGGELQNPTYEAVCRGNTGHAEAVELEYDNNQVTYENLLDVFFRLHDPTQINGQGPDLGTQYRSAVFYHDETQRLAAEKFIERLNEMKVFKKTIATKLEPASQFYSAEDYHQDYFKKNGGHGCHVLRKQY